MKERKKNRCTVCNAIVPRGKKMCRACESTYPCHRCARRDKSTCLCSRWKTWFRLQWRMFYQGSKKHESIKLPIKNEEKPSE